MKRQQPRRSGPELNRSYTFRGLTDGELELLHGASLEVAQRVGFRFFDSSALDLFRRGGASVTDGNLVRIPPRLIEWAVRTAPKNVTLYDRQGRRALWLGGHRSYFGVGSDCSFIYDLRTGERRRAVLADVWEGVRLVDALPNLDFAMSMFLPDDAPLATYEVYQMAAMLQATAKPIIFVGTALASTIYAIELAAVVAGGLDALARRPFVVNYVNPATPFQHNAEAVRRLLYAAERNIPSIYTPPGSRGINAPMTQAGAMAVGNAGQLAGLVLSQLKREGSPFIRSGAGSGGLDMRTMVSSYASPDGGPFGWELAHRYGLPIFGTAGCSDAKVFDAQAAAEAALSLLGNTLGGANLIHDIGYLDCATTGSLELVAYCDELIGWIRCYLHPVEITEETLALDLIEQIGPDGSFLETEHTLRHCREAFAPDLADRRNYVNWAADGATTLQERATQKVAAILEHHRPDPLPPDIVAALGAIVARADADPSFAAAS